jgi:hypothetical protein
MGGAVICERCRRRRALSSILLYFELVEAVEKFFRVGQIGISHAEGGGRK